MMDFYTFLKFRKFRFREAKNKAVHKAKLTSCTQIYFLTKCFWFVKYLLIRGEMSHSMCVF